MKLRLGDDPMSIVRWAFLAVRHSGFRAKAPLLLTALVLTPVPTWSKLNKAKIEDLVHNCSSLGKQDSCRKLAKIAVEGKDANIRRIAVAWLTD